ncbi:hypothetical protein [Glycomyces albidus]|jgi:hypothetical protein|uniref:Uncharacterized protein n=1 Tax=Glycomyces albidus TaxID=2656774 RepID=A0A6L5GFG4_9ACTN|nr:hypothetical protein [Glycomyces albidus]MQM28346.1 hypothetical protein [Glycomyces albidus]
MPDSPGDGGQFTADLYELYEVAQNELRPLARLYGDFSSTVDETRSCNLDPAPVGGSVGRGQSALRSGSALVSLRDDVQYAFARSSENIETAAATLVEVTENYADTDDTTRADFESFKAEDFPTGTTPRPTPAPVYPDADSGNPLQNG